MVLSAVSFLFSAHMFFEIRQNGAVQFLVDVPWISSLGVHFKVGMDGISFILVQLTNLLVPLIILSSFNRDITRPKAFYSLILFMQFALNGVFTAQDGFLFYIFWELALIPIWFICLVWGGEDSPRITLKFFIYTLTGSLCMLFALIFLYLQTPAPHTFDLDAFYALELEPGRQALVFWMLLAGFAVKIPLFPLHTWQPDTYTDAPTPGTMLLSGIMLKMGIYGLIRWLIPVVPAALDEWGHLAMMGAVAGIVYASCIALMQADFKRLIAYSSIAHVGLISAGILTRTPEGLQGGVVQMVAHGINAIGLFFIADMLMHRMRTREMAKLGGLAHREKIFSVCFMIVLLGSIALPLTNGFVGEFLLLNGIFQYGPWTALFAGTTVILGAVYMLRAYKAIMLGEDREANNDFTPLHLNEKALLVIVAALVLITGIWPSCITSVTEPAISNLLMLSKG